MWGRLGISVEAVLVCWSPWRVVEGAGQGAQGVARSGLPSAERAQNGSGSAWDAVSGWIDREGSISNAKLCDIAKVDTLKASRMLVAWRDQGLLVPVPGRAKRNMACTKPAKAEAESGTLLSGLEDNNAGNNE